MKGNSVLGRYAEPWMQIARTLTGRSGQTETLFGEAQSWSRDRRAIIKAEVVRHPGRDPKDNTRFVSTNLRHKAENVYKIYRGRGDAENRIEEMQELHSDRTSCTRLLANQLRLIMSATGRPPTLDASQDRSARRGVRAAHRLALPNVSSLDGPLDLRRSNGRR